MPEFLAPAKINLFLHVGPARPDGYHAVCSLMDRVGLFDTLAVSRGSQGVSISGMDLPAEDNIITRAVAALERETGTALALDIRMRKQIPLAAGLAGGSSDAAALLKAAVSLYGLEVAGDRLEAVALALGADVPFFLTEGPQLAQGAGEELEPVGPLPPYQAVLVTPDVELSTAEVYRLHDKGEALDEAGFRGRTEKVRSALAGDISLELLASMLVNDLEAPALRLCPGISSLKAAMLELGAAGSLMSGSGPTVFGLFGSADEAVAAAASLGKAHERVWQVKPFRHNARAHDL